MKQSDDKWLFLFICLMGAMYIALAVEAQIKCGGTVVRGVYGGFVCIKDGDA